MPSFFTQLVNKLRLKHSLSDRQTKELNVPASSINTAPCCGSLVHIAYRGISDGRLYLVRDKKWQEVKFFKPVGLRVYCQKCRQRIF